MQYTFDANHAMVAVSGQLTFPDHATFRAMANLLFKCPPGTIVMDLSRLEFIDSAGLGMLLIARDEAGRASHKLVLRAPRGQVKRMFDISKFGTLFAVEA